MLLLLLRMAAHLLAASRDTRVHFPVTIDNRKFLYTGSVNQLYNEIIIIIIIVESLLSAHLLISAPNGVEFGSNARSIGN